MALALVPPALGRRGGGAARARRAGRFDPISRGPGPCTGSGPPGAPGAGAGRRAGSAGPGAPGLFWTRREPLPGAAGRELELELEGGELEGGELEGGGPGAGHKKTPGAGPGVAGKGRGG